MSQNIKDLKNISEIEKFSMEKGSIVSELSPVELFSNEFTIEELSSLTGYTQRRFPDAIFLG